MVTQKIKLCHPGVCIQNGVVGCAPSVDLVSSKDDGWTMRPHNRASFENEFRIAVPMRQRLGNQSPKPLPVSNITSIHGYVERNLTGRTSDGDGSTLLDETEAYERLDRR